MDRMRRITVAGLLAAALPGAGLAGAAGPPPPADPDLSRQALLADPATPVGGNPEGDVTIVAFFDYNCPHCIAIQPALKALLSEDRRLRIVYKDWPIFGAGSIAAARLALAARWQGRYEAVHDALLADPVRKVGADQIRAIAVKAGADAARLDADLMAHRAAIDAVLARTEKQADRLGLQGTPVFLVGPFVIEGEADLDGFRKAVAQARARSAAP